MTILVTGGGGFLGSAVARLLRERGHVVRTLQRGAYPHLATMGVECGRGDVAILDDVLAAVRGCNVVVHVAAKAGVWGSFAEYHRANVRGTQNVVAACGHAGVSRLVYTSSPSVVFDGHDEDGIDEEAPYPPRYLAHYPRTKALAEQMVLAANSPQLATVALRPHLIWGPGDPHLVPRVIERAKAGRLRLVGRGDKLVDSTYIDNAAAAHVLAAERLAPGAACAGKAYFISNGEPLPMAELFNRILAAAGLPPVARRIPAAVAFAVGAASEWWHTLCRNRNEPLLTRFVAKQLSTAHWFDISAARLDLGYQPLVPLTEGFRRLAAHLRQHPQP